MEYTDPADQIPTRAEEYSFPEPNYPEGMDESLKSLLIDNKTFSNIALSKKLTQAQANELRNNYLAKMESVYATTMEAKRLKDNELAESQAEEREIMQAKHDNFVRGDGLHYTPEEASAMISMIVSDPEHNYWNGNKPLLQEKSISLVHRLREIVAGKEVSIEGHYADTIAAKEERFKNVINNPDPFGLNRSSKAGGTSNEPSVQEVDLGQEEI